MNDNLNVKHETPGLSRGFALFDYGFRVFFFLAALWASLAIPFWYFLYSGTFDFEFLSNPLGWHAREMIFGFASAAMAGFLLTAVPNWTGAKPKAGLTLILFSLLWVLGRVFVFLFLEKWPSLTLIIDVSFPIVLAYLMGLELWKAGNKRNFPIIGLILLFALASGLNHWGSWGDFEIEQFGLKMGISVLIFLISLIGGRIIPAFTGNWLRQKGESDIPAPFSNMDKITLGANFLTLSLWLFYPWVVLTSWMFVLAGFLNFFRLSRWKGFAVFKEPLLFVLHLAYFWIPIAFLLMSLSVLVEGFPQSAGLHAMTAGAIGSMVMIVMSRAVLGHSGKQLTSNFILTLAFVCLTLGAIIRVTLALTTAQDMMLVMTAGLLWSGAFILFLIRFFKLLFFK